MLITIALLAALLIIDRIEYMERVQDELNELENSNSAVYNKKDK